MEVRNKLQLMSSLRTLTEVRHEMVEKQVNPFRISSGGRKVCTTFGIGFQPFRKTETELMKQRFLFRRALGNAAETNLAPIGRGQDDVGALQFG